MKHLLGLIFILTFSIKSAACSCIPQTLSQRFQNSTFVGVIVIKGFETVTIDGERFYAFDVETLQNFKGKSSSKIYSEVNGCGFFGSKNSKWLIFTVSNEKEQHYTSYCSGNIVFDPTIDEIRYPGLKAKMLQRLEIKLSALQFLKEKKITSLDEYGLRTGPTRIKAQTPLENYGAENTFAIYEQTLNNNLEVIKVKPISNFKNKKLSKRILKLVKAQTYLYHYWCIKDIINEAKIIVIVFYCPANEKENSYISINDI